MCSSRQPGAADSHGPGHVLAGHAAEAMAALEAA